MKFFFTTTFPTSLDSFTNPTGANTLASPDHAGQHANINDAVAALETKVGINSSAVNTTIDYKLSSVTAGDKAVSKTGSETLTNKTLTSPVINVTSDATGDLYYRNSGGLLTRLPIGSTNQILLVAAGLPSWAANPSATNASFSQLGVVQGDTDAATSGLTFTAGVINVNTGTGPNQIPKLTAASKYPAIDGSLITNITNPAIYKNGTTSYDLSTASGTQNIAHGLGVIPKYIRITFFSDSTSGTPWVGKGVGVYNGTTNSYAAETWAEAGTFAGAGANNGSIIAITTNNASGNQSAVATWDSTNIILTWTKANSPAGTAYLMWEAFA